MNEVDEAVLREVLRARSETSLVPPAPVDDLLAGGRAVVRRRRVRLAAGAGLVAAVVLIGGVLMVQPDDAKSLDPVDRRPTPTQGSRLLRDMHQGALPALPFAETGTLYVNGGTIDIEARGVLLAVGGHTMVLQESAAREGEPSPILLLDPTTGQPARRLADDGWRPTVSADGQFVAWLDADGTARVRLWDVEADAELDPISFPFTPTCCDDPFVLFGVDGDGAVYGRGGNTVWVASEGHVAQAVGGLGGPDDPSISEVGAHRLVVADGLASRVGHVDGSGFREEFHVSGVPATLSADETSLAYVDGDTVRIRNLESGAEVEMRLPTDVTNVAPTWETDTDLLVKVQAKTGERDGNAWLRCSARTGVCELATEFSHELPTLPSR